MAIHSEQFRALQTLDEANITTLLGEALVSRFGSNPVLLGEAVRLLSNLLDCFRDIRSKIIQTLTPDLRSKYVDVVRDGLENKISSVTRARVSYALSLLFSHSFFSLLPNDFDSTQDTSRLEVALAEFNDMEEWMQIKNQGVKITKKDLSSVHTDIATTLVASLERGGEGRVSTSMSDKNEPQPLDKIPLDLFIKTLDNNPEKAGNLLRLMKIRARGLKPEDELEEMRQYSPNLTADNLDELLKDLPRAKEILSLFERMAEQYQKELDRLEFYELVDENSHIPTFPQIMATFTPEMLRNVIEHKFQEPKLILVPPVPFITSDNDKKSLIKAMNEHKTMSTERGRQDDVLILGNPHNTDENLRIVYKEEHEETNGPKTWQSFLVEGATDIKPQDQGFGDNPNALMKDRLKHFDQIYADTSVQGMDRWSYSHLMMTGLMEGQPIDKADSSLLLKDPAKSATRFPYARWAPDPRRVSFGAGNPDHRAHLRRSVGGEVPNT